MSWQKQQNNNNLDDSTRNTVDNVQIRLQGYLRTEQNETKHTCENNDDKQQQIDLEHTEHKKAIY